MGVLGDSWNEFDTITQDLGWGEQIIDAPVTVANLELRIVPTNIPSSGGPVAPGLNIFEDFESGFTTFTNTGGDDNNCWRRDSGGTGTGNTGPSTGAEVTTWYVYYEASSGCSPGAQQAFLAGPTIDFDSFNGVEVQFLRHMWDNGFGHMGRLALELEDSTGSGTFSEVWFDEGDQGNQWDHITVDLSSENNSGQRQLRFVATELVSGAKGDMAVDEISIQGVAGPTSVSSEDFESGLTTWINTSGDDNNCWRRDSGGTGTGNTGPSTGADGTTWYVYYEASSGCSPGAQQAFLAGPTINFDAFSNTQVQFSRHMWDNGFGHMGRLALELEDSTGSGTFSEVWFDEGNQGNQWDQITVDLSAEDNTDIRQLRFVATELSSGNKGDMAVDEITILGTIASSSSTINLITACIFTSPENIPAGTGLSQGSAICKLLDAPADEGGVAIAEGRMGFDSYVADDELEVLITQMIAPLSNHDELIFDVEFLIEAPL